LSGGATLAAHASLRVQGLVTRWMLSAQAHGPMLRAHSLKLGLAVRIAMPVKLASAANVVAASPDHDAQRLRPGDRPRGRDEVLGVSKARSGNALVLLVVEHYSLSAHLLEQFRHGI
jgi:hypothetical protein